LAHNFDALVLGAGAAGLMCAVEAGKRGRRVAVLERAERIGKKILVSGGGRCNFTNIYCQPENFLSHNSHFAKSALARYTPSHFVSLVEKHRIPYHEKTLGQLFCNRSAQDIVSMIEDECREAGVRRFLNTAIDEVRRSTHFVVRAGETEFHAPTVVVATGGLSIPKIGATGFGYEVARQFGLSIRPARPALVPLVLGIDDRDSYCDLAGVLAEVVASIGKHHFREKMLITHRGLSGPAILQISSYWNRSQAIMIDLGPQRNVTAALQNLNSSRSLAAAKPAFRAVLPSRLADRWLELHGPANWTNSALGALEHQVHRWAITPVNTEGYA
jgi:predicted Rossmann fold flavoprotein